MITVVQLLSMEDPERKLELEKLNTPEITALIHETEQAYGRLEEDEPWDEESEEYEDWLFKLEDLDDLLDDLQEYLSE